MSGYAFNSVAPWRALAVDVLIQDVQYSLEIQFPENGGVEVHMFFTEVETMYHLRSISI